MSKNKKGILNEGTIRRFMKLAEIDKLSDGFVGSLSEAGYYSRKDGNGVEQQEEQRFDPSSTVPTLGEEDVPFEGDPLEADPLAGEEGIDDMGGEEPAMDAGLDDVLATLSQEQKEGVVGMAVEAFASALGVDAHVETGEGEVAPEEELPTADLDPEAAAPEGVEELEEAEGDPDDPDPDPLEMQERVVNEIVRKVAERLTKEKRQDTMADTLAERIMTRLKDEG